MESQSLERASQYLNNLLLARGLLSNGKPIEFARPNSPGRGADATMSRIINLVHDLVLRRDQDAEQREILAMNIRAARADDTQRVLDLQRLQDKNAELARAAASAESQERALKVAARKAEAQAKELKEQMLKMRSTLDQVRARCLSDVRKRDAELDKLKAHLSALQRGKKEASGMKVNVINWEPEIKGKEKRNGQYVNSTEWGLEKETNGFLAAVLNETSTENVSLRRIITDTMEILSDLTGLSRPDDTQIDHESGDEADPGQFRKARLEASQAPGDLTSCTSLADQMSTILEHCQSILKDPSFVPIEEVRIRDEEISKLRAGWEKMATKWKEAVTMMDDWRRHTMDRGEKLSENGFPVLELGKSMAMAMLPGGTPVLAPDEGSQSVLYDNSDIATQDLPDKMTIEMQRSSHRDSLDPDNQQESDLDIPPEPMAKRRASSARRAGLNIGKPIRPLQPIVNNLSPTTKPNRGDKYFSTYASEADTDKPDLQKETENDIWRLETVSQPGQQEPSKYTLVQDESDKRQFRREQGTTLTVAETLAAVEAEAYEARNLLTQPMKKRKQVDGHRAKKGSRRRSTLSPEELAALMGVE